MMTTALPHDWREWPDEAKARLLWRLQARPNQIAPPGTWNVWLVLAGRGYGKTRLGAEDVADYGLRLPGVRIGVIAPTIADARDTCVEGESGLLAALPQQSIARWNRSMGELILKNGTRYKLFSSEEPERLRGPQHHRVWGDELAAWKYLRETWDQMMFGLRLRAPDGSDPQAVATTTPKPLKFLKELLARTDVVVVKGSTSENAKNLSPAALAQLQARYAGTRLGRQELEAEILDDIEGALWTSQLIEEDRRFLPPNMTAKQFMKDVGMRRVVVGVDPAVSASKTSDMTGIVVAALGHDNEGYVLSDRSTRSTPAEWAKRAIRAYDEFTADRIIAEINNGGDLVTHTIHTEDPSVPVKTVHASRGKIVRAEPISALYEQHKIHHVGVLAELEDQMVTWSPEAGGSPDRIDALVWAFTHLMIGQVPIKHHPGAGRGRLAGRR